MSAHSRRTRTARLAVAVRAMPWRAMAAALLAPALASPGAPPALAAGTFTVNTSLDEVANNAVLSLREAVLAANGSTVGPFSAAERAQMAGCAFDGSGNITGGCGAGQADTILLPAGTYTLTLTAIDPENEPDATARDLDVTDPLTLTGAGAEATTINGNGIDRVFHVHGVAFNLQGVTVRNGEPAAENGRGGGLLNEDGAVWVRNSVFDDNATPEGAGGAIYNNGALTVTNSVLGDPDSPDGNQAAAGGGALFNDVQSTARLSGGTVVVHNHSVLFGGGVANAGTLEIVASRVLSNGVKGQGGGISSDGFLHLTGTLVAYNASPSAAGIANGGPATIAYSRVLDNVADDVGGGILHSGEAPLHIHASEVVSNTSEVGGGLSVNGPASLTLTAVSLISNTTELWGGGLYLTGTLSGAFENVTVSGNHAGIDGGGLAALGGAQVAGNNLTITNNRALGDGDGVFVLSAFVTVTNSLVAGNSTSGPVIGGAEDCAGVLASGGYNLLGVTAGCVFSAATGDITGTQPLLGALANNGRPAAPGGPPLTHALLAGSPGLDQGSPAVPGSGPGACAAVDQRGLPRPIGARCDMGAVEAGLVLFLAYLAR